MRRSINKIFRHLNNAYDNAILLVCIVCMLIGGYSMLDNYNIYHQVEAKQNVGYRPKVSEKEITFDDTPLATAWLYVPDTNMNYPIMQGEDNLEYINKDYNGKYSLAGSVFLDFKNKKDFTDSYNILYAHHMDKGYMFGALDKYEDKAYLTTHKVGYVLTKERVYKIDFIKYEVTEATDETIFSLDTKNESRGYTEEDRLIALTTCKTPNTLYRCVLLGKMQEITREQYKNEVEK